MRLKCGTGYGVDRRSLLHGAWAACGLALLPTTVLARRDSSFFAGNNLKIGLELYTLGDAVAKDLDGTLARVAEIGYREIELPNLFGHSPRNVGAAAKGAGLKISSIHLPLLRQAMPGGLSLASEPARIAEALGELGAHWAVAPFLMLPRDFHPAPGEGFPKAIGRAVRAAGADIWKETAHHLNERAAALQSSGIRVAYHNHNVEFAPAGNVMGWDILKAETDPALISFEVDIGWVAAAGLDPVHFLKRLHGRVSQVHVKDVARGSPANMEITMIPADIGTGVLAWREVLHAAYAAGARHFYVEQEPPFKTGPEAAAKVAFDYLSRI